MQQRHGRILRGPSSQVNAIGAGIAFDDLDLRGAARQQAEVLSDPACANARRELTSNTRPVCLRADVDGRNGGRHAKGIRGTDALGG